jgi:hypothetical protein
MEECLVMVPMVLELEGKSDLRGVVLLIDVKAVTINIAGERKGEGPRNGNSKTNGTANLEVGSRKLGRVEVVSHSRNNGVLRHL